MLGEALEEIMRALVDAPRRYEAILANGRSVAARFSDLEADILESYFRGLLEESARSSNRPL